MSNDHRVLYLCAREAMVENASLKGCVLCFAAYMTFVGLLLFYCFYKQSIYNYEVVCNANIYVKDYVEAGA